MTEVSKIRTTLEHGDRVLWIRLAAPPGNVLDRVMTGELHGAIDAHAGRGLAAIVFEGEGRHFSFGASVPEHTRAEAPGMLRRFHGLFRRLATLGVPTIAVVRGQCLGGGLELASWCSFVFAAPEAMFGQPEIRLAVFPPLASLVLPWKIGGARALDLCVTGRSVTAAEAERLGLVSQVAADPAEAARVFLREHLLEKSGPSLAFAERAAREALIDALERRLPALERLYLEELMATPDANEGITAFIEKRPPRWAPGGSS